MLEDFSTSVKAALYSRVSNPLSGAFTLSWAVVNYRVLLTLFADVPYPEKLVYLNLRLCEQGWWGLVWLPGISMLLVVFALPAAGIQAYRATTFFRSKMQEIRVRAESETPISGSDHRAVIDRYEKKISEHHQLMRAKDSEVDRLKRSLDEIETRKSQTMKKVTEALPRVMGTGAGKVKLAPKELSKQGMHIIRMMGRVNAKHTQESLSKLSKMDPMEVRVALRKLTSHKYVSEQSTSAGAGAGRKEIVHYDLAPNGEKLFVEFYNGEQQKGPLPDADSEEGENEQ